MEQRDWRAERLVARRAECMPRAHRAGSKGAIPRCAIGKNLKNVESPKLND